ncbi:ATP-binding protein [Acetobacterium malicum]
MYEDQIEINSPGGLPAGVSKEEYLYGNISVLRNPIIAGVFDRLNIIEKFGTGIARINEEYLHSMTKPLFDVSENRIRIVLPVIKIDKLDLPEDEGIVYGVLKEAGELTRKAIDLKTGFDKTKTIRVLNKLTTRQLITKEGSGRSVTYKLK